MNIYKTFTNSLKIKFKTVVQGLGSFKRKKNRKQKKPYLTDYCFVVLTMTMA